jgi:predicted transcriptional regulator
MSILEESFNKYEIAVMFVLFKAGRELTTSQVSSKADIAWATVKKYLDILEEEGYVYKREVGNRVYWMYASHFKALSDKEKEKWILYRPTPFIPETKVVQQTLYDYH